MTFEELLEQVLALLQRRRRVAYRAVQRQFDLDDTTVEDVEDALLFAHPELVTDEGRGLVWKGVTSPPPTPSLPEAMHSPAAVPAARSITSGYYVMRIHPHHPLKIQG